jgi:hypothetical protein
VGCTPREFGNVNSLLKILNSIEEGSEILRHALKGKRAIGKYVHSKWKAYSNATTNFLALEVELTLEKRKNFRPASHILLPRASVSRPLYQIRKRKDAVRH